MEFATRVLVALDGPVYTTVIGIAWPVGPVRVGKPFPKLTATPFCAFSGVDANCSELGFFELGMA